MRNSGAPRPAARACRTYAKLHRPVLASLAQKKGGHTVSRGRKSAASLVVVPLVPGQGRPEPPVELDTLEARVWREVVAALPAHWIDPAGQLILRRLVAQSAIAERLEERIRALRSQGQDDSKEAGALAARHDVAGKAVANLLTQLRATPRSRMVSRAAGPQIARTSSLRPWEIRSRGQAQTSTPEQ